MAKKQKTKKQKQNKTVTPEVIKNQKKKKKQLTSGKLIDIFQS